MGALREETGKALEAVQEQLAQQTKKGESTAMLVEQLSEGLAAYSQEVKRELKVGNPTVAPFPSFLQLLSLPQINTHL